jgi:hypothetical protein
VTGRVGCWNLDVRPHAQRQLARLPEKIVTAAAGFLAGPLSENLYRVGHLPRDAGSKVGLEVMPVDSVALCDRHCPGERAPTRLIDMLGLPVMTADAVERADAGFLSKWDPVRMRQLAQFNVAAC